MAALKAHDLVEKVISERRLPTMIAVRIRTRLPVNSVAELATVDGFVTDRVLGMNLVRPTLEDVFASVTGFAPPQVEEEDAGHE